jgi:hypothetical protein
MPEQFYDEYQANVVEPYYEKLADEQYERRQETNDEN